VKTVTDALRVSEFVSEKAGVLFHPPFTCMGIEKDGEIIAGVVFNMFEGADIHVSAAGKGWTRGFLADVGEYVFNVLGCERITAVTEQHEIVRFAERLGGQVEGCLRSHFGKGRDAFVVGILREEYRF
jgi:RimJ/RimL family protein N-acetyltransferase